MDNWVCPKKADNPKITTYYYTLNMEHDDKALFRGTHFSGLHAWQSMQLEKQSILISPIVHVGRLQEHNQTGVLYPLVI